MPIQYESLEKILAMDFSQLRALKISNNDAPEELAEADSRATDEALLIFVQNFADFFTQFSSLSKPETQYLDTYESYLHKIIEKVNESEYQYYLTKYKQHGEKAEFMAKFASYVKDGRGLATRMQYWAAVEIFGDSIRNSDTHRYVATQLQKWSLLLKNKNSGSLSRMFQTKSTLDATSSTSVVQKLNM